MYIALFLLTKKCKGLILFLLLFAVLASSIILPEVVVHRFESTFKAGNTYRVLGQKITLDDSAGARIRSWQSSFEKWLKRPLLGYGVPGGGVVYDVQYGRILREVGLLGLLVFFWIIARLFKAGFRSFSDPLVDDFGKGLSLGFISGLIGLLFMGITSEVFIIIRIMEPFWFLAAIVAMLPEVYESSPQTDTAVV
jgi:O-antigen ligase